MISPSRASANEKTKDRSTVSGAPSAANTALSKESSNSTVTTSPAASIDDLSTPASNVMYSASSLQRQGLDEDALDDIAAREGWIKQFAHTDKRIPVIYDSQRYRFRLFFKLLTGEVTCHPNRGDKRGRPMTDKIETAAQAEKFFINPHLVGGDIYRPAVQALASKIQAPSTIQAPATYMDNDASWQSHPVARYYTCSPYKQEQAPPPVKQMPSVYTMPPPPSVVAMPPPSYQTPPPMYQLMPPTVNPHIKASKWKPRKLKVCRYGSACKRQNCYYDHPNK